MNIETTNSLKVLIVDDEDALRYSLRRALSKRSFVIYEADSGEIAIDIAQKEMPNIVLLDNRMKGMNGIETLQHLRGLCPAAKIIIMTAFTTTQTTIEAMKFGAFDYIMKPFDLSKILGLVDAAANVIMETSKEGQSKKQDDAFIEEDLKVGIIGNAPAMQEVYKMIGQVAPTDVTVLITGESGTGKELIARAIHKNSLRAGKPFVAVNCSAIPENLIESELFGHEKGSFTGANQQRIGYFEQCDCGTIFLDEIGDMPLTAQTKILRALQEGEIQRVGGTEIIKVDVRILAATNKSIEWMVKENTFREDLYYRLNVVRILMPALRQRKEDIPLLINFMLKNLSKKNRSVANIVSKEALDVLVGHDWPGNVRELENIIHRSAVLAQGNTILPKDLPEDINLTDVSMLESKVTTTDFSNDTGVDFKLLFKALCKITGNKDILKKVETELIYQAVEASDGVLTKAGKILGITASTLKKRITDSKSSE